LHNGYFCNHYIYNGCIEIRCIRLFDWIYLTFHR
jgi:hypothetical protein